MSIEADHSKILAYVRDRRLVLLCIPQPADAPAHLRCARETLRDLQSDDVLVIGFDGYESDPREVDEIPVVQSFAATLLKTDGDWNEDILRRFDPISRVLLFKAAERTIFSTRFAPVGRNGTDTVTMFILPDLPQTVLEAIRFLS